MPPKRKAGETAKKASKKIRLNEKSLNPTRSDSESATPSREPAKSAARARNSKTSKSAQDQNHEWEILNGDSRDPLLVGVAAANRLNVRFRNRNTDEEENFTYSKEERDIDWNNKEQVKKINDWRRQLFNRKKFPVRVEKNAWAPSELAFLELTYWKLELVAAAGDAQLPHQNKIFEAFNQYFEGREDINDALGNACLPRPHRDVGALSTYVRRHGTALAKLREGIKVRMKDKSNGAQAPTITEDEIVVYMEDNTATYAAKGRNGKKVTPKACTASKFAKHIGTPNDVDDDVLPDAPLLYNPLRNTPMQITLFTMPRPSPELETPSSPSVSAPSTTAIGAFSSAKLDRAKQSRERQLRKFITDAEFRKLERDGWSVPDLPETDDEAIHRHCESRNNAPKQRDIAVSAANALHGRLKCNPITYQDYYSINGARKNWYADLKTAKEKKKEQEIVGEDSEPSYDRHADAASVNALIGLATVPPFGYQSSIRRLEVDPRMPEEDRIFFESNKAALRKVYAARSKAYDEHVRQERDQEDEAAKAVKHVEE